MVFEGVPVPQVRGARRAESSRIRSGSPFTMSSNDSLFRGGSHLMGTVLGMGIIAKEARCKGHTV